MFFCDEQTKEDVASKVEVVMRGMGDTRLRYLSPDLWHSLKSMGNRSRGKWEACWL